MVSDTIDINIIDVYADMVMKGGPFPIPCIHFVTGLIHSRPSKLFQPQSIVPMKVDINDNARRRKCHVLGISQRNLVHVTIY